MSTPSFSEQIADRSLARADVEALCSRGSPACVVGCDLDGVDLSGLAMTGWRFERCGVRKAIFKNAKLAETAWVGCRGAFADFTAAELTDARFQSGDFNNAKFRRAAISTAVFRGTKLTGADFSDVKAFGVSFEEALLVDALLPGMSFRKSAIVRVDFTQADLTRCDFRDCSFEGCSLRGASLQGARFEGADLRGAELGGLRLDDARLFRGATISRAQAGQLLAEMGLKIG